MSKNMAQPPELGMCNTCLSWGAALRCSQCKVAPYCNAECQKKDWKNHKKICKKQDTSKLDYNAIVHKTVDAVPELLGLLSTPLTDPGNAYLQLIVKLVCILNDITTVDNSAKITATDLRFDLRPCRCPADKSGQWHTLLQLTSMHSLTGRGAPFLSAPETLASRAAADARLHAATGRSKDAKDRTSYVKFFWVPVLPGVAKKAVQEMKKSGMSEGEYIDSLVGKFNDMIIHDKVRGAPHEHA
ncbi:unnamed protein product [Peniophora sp. CBMAI 1063]|nr:unnamed protein product [Peniophora sp. CBMAI 1063]